MTSFFWYGMTFGWMYGWIMGHDDETHISQHSQHGACTRDMSSLFVFFAFSFFPICHFQIPVRLFVFCLFFSLFFFFLCFFFGFGSLWFWLGLVT
ncbi:hypothetical protein QBC32DRAFT_106702 [Pseudoneurospora amorphoporcata]|uniref:Uncharacterized protein n=1 Tax=Pseudoneurospora amorphoporcata TaxID=241081 RepID=A0AAN6SI20_9PEZI|nr:hypothetical protein QBC32DRAFT_106702 [Pseudoneurospora amorphoporcata]